MMERVERALREIVGDRRPAFFLDYDGTLVPIVPRPEEAILSAATRDVLGRLAERFVVAVVSGRDREDVERHVGLAGLWYAGSHGFDISGPQGEVHLHAAEDVEPLVGALADRLERELGEIPGAQVEPKRFTVAVHYRRVAAAEVASVGRIVDRAVADHPRFRKASGKMVWEIRPDLDWDKGRAVLRLLDLVGAEHPGLIPVYIGDDRTDEDAFRAVRDSGVGILVSNDPERDTAAGHRLSGPDEVRALLGRIAAA